MTAQAIGRLWDLSGSIRDYDYTKRSAANLKRITSSRLFRQAETDTILRYLSEQMEVVSFGDFLKRFIYESTGMTEPFHEVPEDTYVAYIYDSFERNRAPHAFDPVRSRWSAIVKRWLSSRSVERRTVFLLGFGLNMTDAEVSVFLMKVLKEQDFNFLDPAETVYWYCFHRGLPYAEALQLLDENDFSEETGEKGPDFWNTVREHPEAYLSNARILRQYLAFLKECPEEPEKVAREAFQGLFDRALKAARQVRQREKESTTGAGDIESVLYSGVPRTGDRNLAPADRSMLAGQFGKYRLGRQRLGRLLRGEIPPERFDLLTLLFLDVACRNTAGPDGLAEKFCSYVDEANEMLRKCRLWEVYPVNPYESFLMMCLLTEDPLCAFNDVWENSYGK